MASLFAKARIWEPCTILEIEKRLAGRSSISPKAEHKSHRYSRVVLCIIAKARQQIVRLYETQGAFRSP
jgi:hypothetical protein